MKPAMTAEEWAKVREPLVVEWAQDLPPKRLDQEFRHGLAARCLHEQEFGFTREDVVDERQAYHDAVVLARHYQDIDMEEQRLACRERARRHMERAERIEALLPPEPK